MVCIAGSANKCTGLQPLNGKPTQSRTELEVSAYSLVLIFPYIVNYESLFFNSTV